MLEWHKDLSKNVIHLAVYNKVVADIVVAAGNKASVFVFDIAVAVDNKTLAVDKKIAEHDLVAKNMPAVGDNNNPEQCGPER